MPCSQSNNAARRNADDDWLTEAERTLRAIRQGEVDALVVECDGALAVRTLKGGLHPYRAVVERMAEGALAVSPTGLVLYCNPRFADMLGQTREDIIGRDLDTFVAASDRRRCGALLVAGLAGGGTAELALHRADGSPIPVGISAAPVDLDWQGCLSLVVSDLTARRRAEHLTDSADFIRTILDQASEPIVVCDAAGVISHASLAAERLCRCGPLGRTLAEAFAWQASAGPDVLATALAGDVVHGIEGEIAAGRQTRQFLIGAGPLRDARAAVIGCVITLTDITERKRVERRQALLVAELDHRVKNTLAIIMSLASQTLGSAAPTDQTAFMGRLQALAAAHDLLTMARWDSVSLATLVEATIGPFARAGALDAGGPAIALQPKAVLSIAIALHELATNAAKYGALSVEGGRVEVTWDVIGAASRFRMSWREADGPPVAPPTRRGFGTTLLERCIPYDLDGEVTLAYPPTGVRADIAIPVATLLA